MHHLYVTTKEYRREYEVESVASTKDGTKVTLQLIGYERYPEEDVPHCKMELEFIEDSKTDRTDISAMDLESWAKMFMREGIPYKMK